MTTVESDVSVRVLREIIQEVFPWRRPTSDHKRVYVNDLT